MLPFRHISPTHKFIYHVCRMDIGSLQIVLEEDTNYQDMDKVMFLDLLGNVFRQFKELGDTKLEWRRGKCNGCYKANSGVTFIGNQSRNYIDFVIKTDEMRGPITELCECSDFTTKNIYDLKRDRIYLDDGSDFETWLNNTLK